jgi:hypothetical protein
MLVQCGLEQRAVDAGGFMAPLRSASFLGSSEAICHDAEGLR